MLTFTCSSYLWNLFGKCRTGIFACILLAALQSLSLVPMAWLVRQAFDKVIPSHNFPRLLLVAAGILLLNLFSSAVGLLARYLSLQATKRTVGSIRQQLIARWFALPRYSHDVADQGKIHTLIVQDTELIDVMINALTCSLLPAVVLCAAFLVALAVLNAKLLAVMLLVLPVLYAVNRLLDHNLKRKVARYRASFSSFSTGVNFVLRKIDLARYQCAETFECARQQRKIDQLRVDGQAMAWLQTAYGLLQNGIANVAAVVVLVVGGWDVAAGKISLGSLLSFYVCLAMLSRGMNQLFAAIPQVLGGKASLRALQEFLEIEAHPLYLGKMKPVLTGAIEFASVSFGYGEEPLLTGVRLRLEPGSLTAIVGANGSGKTTFARLILGLYKPQRGHLLADGYPYERLDPDHLRQTIGFAPQDPILFPGSIRENLQYGFPDSWSASLTEACRIALVDDFVGNLPQGYNTPAGEDGGTLSGGQRQKIAIARVLARKPKLLILDEPTNHLDPDSIRRLLANINAMTERPTLLIITQNPSVAAEMTAVYRLEHGSLKHETDTESRAGRASVVLKTLGEGIPV